MNKYQITLEIESEIDPREWIWGDTLIIDENYQVTEVREIANV
jgi:hypothetical protein